MRSPSSPPLELRSLAQAPDYTRASQEELRAYLVYLDHTTLSEAHKVELLQTLWSIMSTFVDLAFGADPVQTILPPVTSNADSASPIPPADDPSTAGPVVAP